MFEGEIEADESYFGGTRKSKCGRGAVGKVAVFGEMARFIPSLSLIHNQRHYCQLSERKLSLIALRTRIPFVVMVSEFSHFRINHSTHFAENHNHINGIENFWNQAKRHLHKFNCIPKEHFELYLKECEWRFNNSEIKSQISILKQFVKGNLI